MLHKIYVAVQHVPNYRENPLLRKGFFVAAQQIIRGATLARQIGWVDSKKR